MQENATNILDVLRQKFDGKTVRRQLQYLIDVQHVFQFSLNPNPDVIAWDQRHERSHEDDAFSFTMKAVMRNLCGRFRKGRIAERCRFQSTAPARSSWLVG